MNAVPTEPPVSIPVFLRVGEDGSEFKIGEFITRVVHYSSGPPDITVTDNDQPLAALLRLAADAIERDGDMRVSLRTGICRE